MFGECSFPSRTNSLGGCGPEFRLLVCLVSPLFTPKGKWVCLETGEPQSHPIATPKPGSFPLKRRALHFPSRAPGRCIGHARMQNGLARDARQSRPAWGTNSVCVCLWRGKLSYVFVVVVGGGGRKLKTSYLAPHKQLPATCSTSK